MAKEIKFRTKAMVEKTSKGWTVNAIATESKKVDWDTVEETMVAKGWNISGVTEENEKGMTYGWFNVLDICDTKAEAMGVYKDMMDIYITEEDLEAQRLYNPNPEQGTVAWIKHNNVKGACDRLVCYGCDMMENCIVNEGTDAKEYLDVDAMGRVDKRRNGDINLKVGDRVKDIYCETEGRTGTVERTYTEYCSLYPYFIKWDGQEHSECFTWSGRGFFNEESPRIEKIKEDGSDDPTPEENFRPMREMTKDEIVTEYNHITGADLTNFHYSRDTFESLLKVARVDMNMNTSHKEKIGHYEFTFIEGDFFGSDYTIKVIEMFDTVAVEWYTRELYYKDRDHMVKDLSDRYNHI